MVSPPEGANLKSEYTFLYDVDADGEPDLQVTVETFTSVDFTPLPNASISCNVINSNASCNVTNTNTSCNVINTSSNVDISNCDPNYWDDHNWFKELLYAKDFTSSDDDSRSFTTMDSSLIKEGVYTYDEILVMLNATRNSIAQTDVKATNLVDNLEEVLKKIVL